MNDDPWHSLERLYSNESKEDKPERTTRSTREISRGKYTVNWGRRNGRSSQSPWLLSHKIVVSWVTIATAVWIQRTTKEMKNRNVEYMRIPSPFFLTLALKDPRAMFFVPQLEKVSLMIPNNTRSTVQIWQIWIPCTQKLECTRGANSRWGRLGASA